ncbi:NmrA/HSCARG family protein [Streptomyces radicis]|uniref:NmrA/HSCARG family protein n=1 Tax=Streptomyces radicis TaxID=1750517 RepID=A0A3A9WCR6_9ACTN|nr:NmrA/HSCARG family protein [Streptomyces radicis]RKN10452.1 NmrA/HSCARG family protein [Streptomyces radicis]RKN24711.1 NmrA/HSCARG family protein [Streptomyces radicis]
MANIDKTVVVLGATGQQGGSVAAALRADGWAVRAVVRDPSGPRARALSAAGVETVRGDLGDPESLRAAFSGAHGVFSVQPSSGQAGAGVTDEDEVRFGTAVADIAERGGVAHLVYSSTVAAGPTPTGIGHFDTKSRVEAHVRNLDIASTVVRPATFMEILTLPGMGLDRGRLSFLMRPDQAMQFIAVRDIGRIVAAVFGSPDRYVGRTVEIAGDALTGEALAEQLTRAVGRPINYGRLPTTLLEQDEVLGRTVALVDSGRLVGNADLDALRAEFPFLLRFDRWLAGPGAGLLTEALRSADTGIALR